MKLKLIYEDDKRTFEVGIDDERNKGIDILQDLKLICYKFLQQYDKEKGTYNGDAMISMKKGN